MSPAAGDEDGVRRGVTEKAVSGGGAAASPAPTGHAVLLMLGLLCMCVRGDGSCWLHAVLACLFLSEHARPYADGERDATPVDRGRDAFGRGVVSAFKGDHPRKGADINSAISRTPRYPLTK